MKVQSLSTIFSEQNYRSLIIYLNNAFNSLTFGDNMSAQIVKGVTIPAGTEIRVAHNLKVIPASRIILRQRGNGLITDGVLEDWTDSYIVLLNNGATSVTFDVLILRE